MSKHTPGPWFAGPDNYIWRRHPTDLYQYGGGVAGDAPLAGVFASPSDWVNKFPVEANARLIAAAPELLEALERLKIEVVLSDVDPEYIESHFRPWLDKAEAAMLKARGN